MEADIARLESDVEHLRTHLADAKAEVRALRDKMDAMAERFDKKLEALRERIGSVRGTTRGAMSGNPRFVSIGPKPGILPDRVTPRSKDRGLHRDPAATREYDKVAP